MKSIKLKIFMIFLLFILLLISGNGVFAKYIINSDETLIIQTNLDRTPPVLKTSYSITTSTNGDVTVTITANEKVKQADGWTLSPDKLKLTKTFHSNGVENVTVYDLAGNKAVANVNVNNIDKVIPKVEKISITNSNTAHSTYANSSKEINISFKVSDNIAIKSIDTSKMTIKVGNSVATLTKVLTEKSSTTKEKIYNLKLTNIQGNGVLTVSFENGFVTDTANNKNVKTDINTNITIDNIAPTITYSQSSVSNGKVKAMLTANEKVDKLDGWNITSDNKQNYKEFTSNVSYNITLKDWAGNTVTATVNVTGATYISLVYASHNSNIGWTYGYGNYDIAGKSSVLTNPKYKTEALAFNVTGNVSSDFVRARAYVYHHWGAGANGKCNDSNLIYNYGYNPSSTGWKSMASSDLVTIGGKKYFQFGGAGINNAGKTDTNGRNAIPEETANKLNYGICGISLSLKDYTDYSIVYQIYLGNQGWIKAASNGEETMYSKTSAISALRVVLVPNSERQNVLNTWNKDTGKKIN